MKKKFMEEKNKTPHIPVRMIVVGCILAATIFLLLADNAKTYRSTVSILIIPKSQTTAEQQDAIVRNIASLPQMLSFYDRMLRDNPSIKDTTAGFSPDKRKNIWNEFVKVEKPKNSDGSIIELSVLAKTQSDAQSLSLKAAHTLFAVSSGYYDIRNDLDLRIADGPITAVVVSGWYWLAILSVVLGAVAAYVLHMLTSFSAWTMRGKSEAFENIDSVLRDLSKAFLKSKEKPISSLDDLYTSEQQESAFEVPDEMYQKQPVAGKIEAGEDMVDIQQRQYPNFPEMPVRNASPASNTSRSNADWHIEAGGPTRHVSTASAPDNLPVADNVFFPTESAAKIEIMPEDIEEPEIKNTEPTQEELKKRLNELLNGKL